MGGLDKFLKINKWGGWNKSVLVGKLPQNNRNSRNSRFSSFTLNKINKRGGWNKRVQDGKKLKN